MPYNRAHNINQVQKQTRTRGKQQHQGQSSPSAVKHVPPSTLWLRHANINYYHTNTSICPKYIALTGVLIHWGRGRGSGQQTEVSSRDVTLIGFNRGLVWKGPMEQSTSSILAYNVSTTHIHQIFKKRLHSIKTMKRLYEHFFLLTHLLYWCH